MEKLTPTDRGMYNLYLAALWTVPISIYLLTLYYQKKGCTPLFVLPTAHLICATIYVVFKFNIAYLPITDIPTLQGMLTVCNICDAISTTSFCYANLIRLRFVVGAAARMNDVPSWVLTATWLMAIPGTLFPITSIVSIACLYSDSLASAHNGLVCQYVPSAFNLFYSSDELTFHILFVIFLLRQATFAPPRVRLIWIGFSFVLITIAGSIMIGAIVGFFHQAIGEVLVYSFWLANNSAFLTMNRIVNKKMKSYAGSINFKGSSSD